jgi:hypothetical protein
MRLRGIFLVLGLLVLLAGCGQWNLTPQVDITPGFEPTVFGFEIDDGTIVVASNTLTFTSRRGSIGARIDGYQIEYLDPAGSPIRVGDSILYSRGSLGVVVPPGLICPEEPCTINSPGVQFVERRSLEVENTVTLPGPIAIAVLQGEFVGARANVYFTGTSDLGQALFLGPYEVAVVYPVGAN